MMEMLSGFGVSLGAFIVVLGILVFVHEYGHFWVARRGGVTVEAFSIGFGPEIFGWRDRHGTRWKVSWVPLGGYVKFRGDLDGSSQADPAAIAAMDPVERAGAFHLKPLRTRAAVVAAGPAANFLFAFVVLLCLFLIYGQAHRPPVVDELVAGGAAEAAGLEIGDRIVSIEGREMADFEDLRAYVAPRAGETVRLIFARAGQEQAVDVTLGEGEVPTITGDLVRVGLLGIRQSTVEHRPLGPVAAAGESAVAIGGMVTTIGRTLGEMIVGQRSIEELGGPIRIAEYSGDMARQGMVQLLWFMALLSVNLGLINLLPVPVLDGGHLLLYSIEAVRGRPLGRKAQEVGFRIGLALVLTLMVVATWNDLARLNLGEILQGFVS